jgi:hypothetical protein
MAFDAKLRFQTLCKTAADEVRAGQTKTNIIGVIENRAKRFLSGNGMAACGPVLGKLITFGIAHVPFLGPTLSVLIDGAVDKLARTGMNAGLNRLMKSNVADMTDSAAKLQHKGVLLFETVAPTYLDAIRKYEESREAAAAALPNKLKNCEQIGAYLKTVYYWGYRMNRLRAHHDEIMAYCNAVGQYLGDAEKSFLAFQAELQAKGPSMFDDWRWHYANCDKVCYWPGDFGQEISSPTNAAAARRHFTNRGAELSAPSGFQPNPNGPSVLGKAVPPSPELRTSGAPIHTPVRQNASRNLMPPDKNRRG